MAEWFKEYWQYALGLLGVCVVAFFVFRAAAKAYSAHQKSFREEEKYILHLKELKEKYVPLTEEIIAAAPFQELLEGTALGIQLFLQRFENMEAEFEKLNTQQQLVYTLDIFVSDKDLSSFFRQNSSVLKKRLVPALEMISLHEEAELIAPVAAMFDDADESASLDEKIIDDVQRRLEKNDFLSLVKLSAAKYIQKDPEAFVSLD